MTTKRGAAVIRIYYCLALLVWNVAPLAVVAYGRWLVHLFRLRLWLGAPLAWCACDGLGRLWVGAPVAWCAFGLVRLRVGASLGSCTFGLVRLWPGALLVWCACRRTRRRTKPHVAWCVFGLVRLRFGAPLVWCVLPLLDLASPNILLLTKLFLASHHLTLVNFIDPYPT